MKLYIGVEDFGKIKTAYINVSDFTIFVGDNNSGKTLLMQLIYGVLNHFSGLYINDLNVNIMELLNSNGTTVVNNSFIDNIVQHINKHLEEKKEEIVYQTFHNNIPIRKLLLNIELENNDNYEILYYKGKELYSALLNDIIKIDEKSKKRYMIRIEKEKKMALLSFNDVNNQKSKRTISFPYQLEKSIIASIVIDILINVRQSLFLPASRNGLMLLYKNFFANTADEIRKKRVFDDEEKIDDFGLTTPVYNYLRFLQTYRENLKDDTKNIMTFIENYLIDGNITSLNDGMVMYKPVSSDVSVPLYLASSTVNELTPIIYALSCDVFYNMIFIDEIETSLHPSKQVEMARLLNRLINSGMKLMVSTHSDTMVTKINNLLLVSSVENENRKNELLNKLELDKLDLLNDKKISVYQFKNSHNGTSNVEELKFDRNTGYEFTLFTDNVIKLYNEASTISEIEK
ncbi:MAG: hypothetical protein K0R34_1278 [Herbinix sp.]|jgi:ABC-type polar amino acid transport system ATPase subunit|nr:hypothetical protein [Herbinix sp.]